MLRSGIINSYPSLRKNISCDVLIVGGGLAGALLAFQFSGEGYKTVVIDKRDIAMGSTSANTSMLQYEIDEPLYSLMDSVGKEVASDTYREGIRAIKKLDQIVKKLNFDCGFKTKESLHFAHNSKKAEELINEFECRKKIGINVKWLTSDQLASSYGLVGEGGILSEVGASLNAYQLTHSLLEYCVKEFGLQVYDHTELEKIDYINANNQVMVDTSYLITCSHIVYATGYETHELISTNIGKLVSTYACISEPLENLPGSLADTIFWNTQDPYFYFRSTSDNRILIGGEDENFKNPEKRDRHIQKKESDLIIKFNQLVPGINLVADFSWAGTFGVTKDALPYIGSHADYPNSYFMLGYGGNGITFSIMGMEILADAIAGRPNKFLEYFKFNR